MCLDSSYLESLVTTLISDLVLCFLKNWDTKPLCRCFNVVIQAGSTGEFAFQIEVSPGGLKTSDFFKVPSYLGQFPCFFSKLNAGLDCFEPPTEPWRSPLFACSFLAAAEMRTNGLQGSGFFIPIFCEVLRNRTPKTFSTSALLVGRSEEVPVSSQHLGTSSLK